MDFSAWHNIDFAGFISSFIQPETEMMFLRRALGRFEVKFTFHVSFSLSSFWENYLMFRHVVWNSFIGFVEHSRFPTWNFSKDEKGFEKAFNFPRIHFVKTFFLCDSKKHFVLGNIFHSREKALKAEEGIDVKKH